MSKVSKIISTIKKQNLSWDFYENVEDVRQAERETIPGMLIGCLNQELSDPQETIRTIGLLTTFAAKRCSVCWFVNCTNEKPLHIINQLEDFWLDRWPVLRSIDESWTEEIIPEENGMPISDCRYYDQVSVSHSVEHAAKYAKYLDEHDAILALCYACYAFDLQIIEDNMDFENWFFEIAIKAALEKRKLTDEEKFSYSTDFIRKMMNGRPF